jgi:hypothetical protein
LIIGLVGCIGRAGISSIGAVSGIGCVTIGGRVVFGFAA